MISRDGSAAICQRVESSKRAGDAGYLHRLHDDRFRPAPVRRVSVPVAPEKPAHDFEALARQYEAAMSDERCQVLSADLGLPYDPPLTVDWIRGLHVGWDGESFTFPMSDGRGRVVGIRRRFRGGRKLSVKGGREGIFEHDVTVSGIFTPFDTDPVPLFIAEGPTDCAALLSLRLDAIGRPSCRGGVRQCIEYAKRRSTVVVVADRDASGVGEQGARFLALALAPYVQHVFILRPPTDVKDVREWVRCGATVGDVALAACFADEVRLKVRSTP